MFRESPWVVKFSNCQEQKNGKVAHGHEGATRDNWIEEVEKSKYECDSSQTINLSNLNLGSNDDHMIHENPINFWSCVWTRETWWK